MPAFTVQQAFDLAVQQHQAGRIAEAEALYRQILVLNPNHASAQNNVGSILAGRKLWTEAFKAFARALDIEPTNAEIHHNVALSMMELGRIDEALTEYRKAVEIQPDHARAYSGLANALRLRGELDAALAACSTAVKLAPGLAAAQNNLGTVLHSLGRFEEAIAAYYRAIHLQPDYAEARINLADAFRSTGRLDESINESSIALHLRPDLAEAANNLGNALKDAGRIEEAITAYRRALPAKPTDLAIRSNLIHVLQFNPKQIGTAPLDELRAYDAKVKEYANRIILPRSDHLDPNRRLRIGYVSPEFRDHVTGRYLRPLFACHGHQNFEIISYSGVRLQDSMTEEFRRGSHLWRNTVGVPDETLTETILADRVDILVDLTQHLAGNRLPVFARKPAPLQVSFAGYPESTGLETIEYRISDSYLEYGISGPEASTGDDGAVNPELSYERVYLIDSFWCYDPCEKAVPINALPGQENGFITFGSLNNFCKVNDPLLKLWARVLRQVRDSRLLMLSGFGSHRQRTVEFLELEGIAPGRVEFVAPRPPKDYLELYHRLDMVLDTLPYNGHTTSLDALWMGVPVVSLSGQTRVSRAGLSVLNNLGAPELVARSPDEFLEIATHLAGDLPRLAELRRTLRPRMESSVLMDGPRFARNIEAAYRAMWRRWCAQTVVR